MTEQEETRRINAAREYARRPDVLAAIKQGIATSSAGNVRPWEDVERELFISDFETGGGNE